MTDDVSKGWLHTAHAMQLARMAAHQAKCYKPVSHPAAAGCQNWRSNASKGEQPYSRGQNTA